MKFVLSTDTSCDVLKGTLEEKQIAYLPLTYTIAGTTYPDNLRTDDEYKDFYQKIREGAMPITSQITPVEHEQFFGALLRNGAKAVVHLCLSGGLSSTYNSAKLGAQEALKNYPDAEVYVIDTISATQAHHYLLQKAEKCRDEGKTAHDTFDHLEEAKHNIQVWFMASDLMHLRRGGRVSAAAAILGTMLKIKPILIINKTGGLTVVHKAKGVAKSMEYFIERLMKYNPEGYKTVDMMIAHADCEETAKELVERLRGKGCKGEISYGWIGPIIGAHTGPGALGLIFDGAPRISTT